MRDFNSVKNSILRIIFFPVALLMFFDCSSDAPRDNPLDPVNGIQLSGQVQRFYDTRPIDNAVIMLKPGNLIGRTNGGGNYTIDNISAGTFTIVCQADGFWPDSVEQTLEQQATADFRLDALPFFTNISITTQHIFSFINSVDTFFVEFEVSADDPDGAGDVDFVHYSIDPFAFSDTLIQVSPQAQRYIGQLELSDLGIASIDELNGQPFTFFVEDLPGAIVSSGAQFITRIINETPVALAPVNTIIQPPFTFEWEAFPVTYSFSYDIQIFQINFNIFTLVDEITGIPSSQTSVEYSRSLDRGEYFWVLFVIDEFGNKSRSVENPFTVP